MLSCSRMTQINLLTILKRWQSRCHPNKIKALAPDIIHIICCLLYILTISSQHNKMPSVTAYLRFFVSVLQKPCQ